MNKRSNLNLNKYHTSEIDMSYNQFKLADELHAGTGLYFYDE